MVLRLRGTWYDPDSERPGELGRLGGFQGPWAAGARSSGREADGCEAVDSGSGEMRPF